MYNIILHANGYGYIREVVETKPTLKDIEKLEYFCSERHNFVHIFICTNVFSVLHEDTVM